MSTAIYSISTKEDGEVDVGACGAGTCECGQTIRRSVDGTLYERAPNDVGSYSSVDWSKTYRRHDCPEGGNGRGPVETESVWSDSNCEGDE